MRSRTLLAAVLLGACAGNPAPGEPGYPYNVAGQYDVEFVVQGEPHVGTAELTTAPGGTVAGTFRVVSPTTVTGTIAGIVADGEISFKMPYTVAAAGCGGTAEASGTVQDGGGTITGTLSTNDGCAGQSTGAFTMQRR